MEHVMPFPAAWLAEDQPRCLQLAQVSGGCRPGVREPPGKLTRRHGTPAGLKHLKDVPSGRVGKGMEDLLDLVGFPLASARRRGQCATARVRTVKCSRWGLSSATANISFICSHIVLTAGWV